jgi:hypothetical protein
VQRRRAEAPLAGAPPAAVVLVEGDSDAAAVHALARRHGMDLEARGVRVTSAGGVTNFPALLEACLHSWPGAPVLGLYDHAEEHHVRRALERSRLAPSMNDLDRAGIEAHGFFVCVADLEDELIRALGTEAVEAVLAREGELRPFRTFQAQPAQRDRAPAAQLRRFLGTKSLRKIRYGTLLVDALELDRVPAPLAGLIARLG